MRTRVKWLFAGGIALFAIPFLLYRGTVIVDTEEDLWPDPRDREAVHLRALSGRLQAYARDNGALPSDLTVIGQPINRPDEWGAPIKYERRGPVLVLQSAGPDRRFKTPDDIVVSDGTTYESKRTLYLAVEDSARKHP